jgi:hypothetical protein
MRNFFAAGLMLLAAGSTIAAAQEPESKNEVAVTIGRTFISDQGVPNTNFFDNTVHFGKGLSFEGDYARRMRRYFWGDLAVRSPGHLQSGRRPELRFEHNTQAVQLAFHHPGGARHLYS